MITDICTKCNRYFEEHRVADDQCPCDPIRFKPEESPDREMPRTEFTTSKANQDFIKARAYDIIYKEGLVIRVCKHGTERAEHCVHCFEDNCKEDKSQKPAISTLPVDSLFKIAMVFQWVIKQGKYKEDDWRKGVSWKDNYNSMQRHLMDYYKGQDFDKETGIETLAHAGCRLLMALEMQLKKTGVDNRFKEK